ncbi:FecR family protein [Adhaeribacter swui]|uniref:FecR family protein n=1 Tax=Adhaeribacter swui TaxID=2086471 RepID=A0A7G7G7T7_9BACT|nr:FecR domain-containing protein [Adhaeribacter swui]QNF33221.1 FecR family protein [Adhaeribacter swui]
MKPAIQDLIQKYLQGKATAEEKALVDAYYRSFAKEQPYTPYLTPQSKELLEEKIYAGILQNIEADPVPETKPNFKFITNPRAFYFSVAASFVGILLAFSYYFFIPQDQVVLTTALGQVATFTLPDNSKVTLNGNSELRYTPWSAHQTREVTLRGEAYFSVQHTKNHQKFLVHLPGKMQIEVLGTEFNVTGRPNNTRVVLNSGKVRLRLSNTQKNTPKEVEMEPGDMVELEPKSAKVAKIKVNPEKYSSWSSSMLVLDKTTLRELVSTLENTYGLQVTVPDTSLLRHTFSGKVPKQDAQILLLGLSKAFNLQITKKENQIIIQKH